MRAGLVLALALATLPEAGAQAQSSSPFSGLFGRESEAEGPVALQIVVAPGGEPGLERRLRNASLVQAALTEGRTTGQDMLAAARADYARLLGNLYDEGHFAAAIDITLDGVEAATVQPLDAPDVVRTVRIAVAPGPRFRFSRAQIAPLARGTALPDGFAVGEVATTGVIKDAATSAVKGWRDVGHAKAEIGDRELVADHPAAALDARIAVAPGPVVTFGALRVQGLQRLREDRLREIVGFEGHEAGSVFSPDALEAMRRRLRRSGVFSAITVQEAESLNRDGSMDIDLTLVEQKPRRFSFGLEVSNRDGATVSGAWLHRNLFGGAERLRIEGKVADLGADSGEDYTLSARIERPATFGRDVTAYAQGALAREREPEASSDSASFRVGLDYFRDNTLSGGVALEYRASRVTDATGTTDFRVLALPLSGAWDRRDEAINPTRGFWLKADVTPFTGLDDTTGTGARAELEGRAYRPVGERVVLATRARLGTVFGTSIGTTPRDYLFYSGGGGSVRGQPFRSLGARVIPGPDGPILTGGMSVANLTAEARIRVRENIGLAVFADAGQVWTESTFGGDSDFHAGAGIGIRYATPIGPIRFDIATPVAGETGDGVQLYLGLGQAF